MKKIIDGKRYDTSTAEEVGSRSNGYRPNDLRYCLETLYRTTTGKYFLHGEGNANSRYAVERGDTSYSGQSLVPMSEAEAFEWASLHLKPDEFENLFPHLITDA